MQRNKTIDLIRYSHDRDADFKKSSDEIRDLIDKFADQEQLSSLYDYFQKRYSLPESVVKQKIKKRIATSYAYRGALFNKEFNLRRILVSIMKHFGLLFYALIYSRIHTNASRYKLIVDGVTAKLQLLRFKKLIDLFGKKNVLIVSTVKIVGAEYSDYNIKFAPRFKYYDIIEVLKSIWHELLFGVWLYLSVSISLRVNLLPAVSPVINDYLHYGTLFKTISSDYTIQERQYGTSSVKNYLFKKHGGRATTSIQRNLVQLDTAYYYCDIDCLFSLGNRTAERYYEYGERIGRVIPVGSMFMEYYWFRDPIEINKKFDVALISTNVGYERMDSYSKFMDDYYNCFRWIVRFKKEYPSYRIIIKYNSYGWEDKTKNEIMQGSGIETLPKEADNSYRIAFSSRCSVAYGSTMGYELNAHGIPTFFLDPGYRCTTLPDRDDNLLDGIRMASYETFRDAVLSVLDGAKEVWLGHSDDLCLNSSAVSERIYKALLEL
jgi:hypothetical protein